MKINQMTKIDDKKGDWLILTDYGTEGIAVTSQHKTPEDAIKNLGGLGGDAQAIVKLVDFQFTTSDA